jgi:hypothetical protein
VLTWTLRAISIVLFSIVLMPTKGAMGVALAQLAGTALASLTLLGLVLVQMRSALRVTHSTDLLTAQPE